MVILHGGWSKVSVVDFIYGIHDIPVPCPNNASHDAVVVGDFNGDGRQDIALVNTFAGLSILLNTTGTPPAAVSNTATAVINIKIYPNPFTKELAIEAPGKFFATIYTTVGKAIATEVGENRLILNGASLPAGMYLLVVEDGNHSALFRSAMIKE